MTKYRNDLNSDSLKLEFFNHNRLNITFFRPFLEAEVYRSENCFSPVEVKEQAWVEHEPKYSQIFALCKA